MLANLRQLWDAGVIVAFGTDTAALRPAAAVAHETRTLSEVLSEEPALAPAVMLHIPEALAVVTADTKIKFLDVLILG